MADETGDMVAADQTPEVVTAGRPGAAQASFVNRGLQERDLTERLNVTARAVALGVLIALVGIAFFGRFYTARFNGLITEEAMEMAALADRLRSGEGFTSGVTRPLALTFEQPPAGQSGADLLHAPLYPYLLSLMFRVRGAGDATVAMFNGLLFLITGWVIYALARSLWDKPVAIVAVLLYFVSIEAIGQALMGTATSLAALLVTLSVWAALRSRAVLSPPAGPASGAPPGKPSTWAWPLAAGALFGAVYLTGQCSLLLLLPFALLALPRGAGKGKTAALLGAVLLVLLPWLVRDMAVAGTPWGALSGYRLLANTATYPGDTVFQQMPGTVPSPLAFAAAHTKELLQKTAGVLSAIYRGAPNTVNPYLLPFFVLGAFLFAGAGTHRSLWRTVVAMALLQIPAACLFWGTGDAATSLLPLAVVLSAGALMTAVRRAPASRWMRVGVPALIVLLVAFPTVMSAALGGKFQPHPSSASLRVLRDNLADDAVIAADIPAAVAWYARKRAVLLPADPPALGPLQNQGLTVHYVYLSGTQTPRAGGVVDPRKWVALLQDPKTRSALGTILGLPRQELLIERVNKRQAPGAG